MRVRGGFVTRRRHKRLLKQAQGFRGRRGNCYRLAKLAVQKALVYAYRDRKARKRDFRTLWIARINAGARSCGLTYSLFMRGLRLADIQIDRKVLADMAMQDPATFNVVAARAKAMLS